MTRLKYLRNNGSDKTPHIFLVIEPAGITARGTTEETLAKIAKGPKWEEMKKDMSAPDIAEVEALGAKISLCSLATSSNKGDYWESSFGHTIPVHHDYDYKGINIHTKVLISDDVFFTIGSANFNYRSMVSDNELNVACHNEDLAEKLRHQLMGMHMGGGYSDKLDIKELFKEWERFRIANDKIMEDRKEPLLNGSHIVSYVDDGRLKLRAD